MTPDVTVAVKTHHGEKVLCGTDRATSAKPQEGQERAQKALLRSPGCASQILSNKTEVIYEACGALSHLSRS